MMNNYPPSTWSGDALAPWNEEFEYENRMCHECVYYQCEFQAIDCVNAKDNWHACHDFIPMQREERQL